MKNVGLYQIEKKPKNIAINLSANENLNFPEKILRLKLLTIAKTIDLRLYPEPYCESLCKMLANEYSVSENQIAVGNGSDAIIDVIIRIITSQKKIPLIVSPTFSMYEYLIKVGNNTANKVMVTPPPNYDIDCDKILSFGCNKNNSVLFLCNPNNPTGKQYDIDKVKKIIAEFPGLIILDEAYSAFSKYSLSSEINNYSNLVILKTFSKSHGLAGVRIGYSLSSEEVARKIKEILPPYNVNSIAIELAKSLLVEKSLLSTIITEIVEERTRVYNELLEMNTVYPYESEANFIMFKVLEGKTATLYRKLLREGIVVRDLTSFPLCKGCLRATISTKENNSRFLRIVSKN